MQLKTAAVGWLADDQFAGAAADGELRRLVARLQAVLQAGLPGRLGLPLDRSAADCPGDDARRAGAVIALCTLVPSDEASTGTLL